MEKVKYVNSVSTFQFDWNGKKVGKPVRYARLSNGDIVYSVIDIKESFSITACSFPGHIGKSYRIEGYKKESWATWETIQEAMVNQCEPCRIDFS